jgi:hypothetical protein
MLGHILRMESSRVPQKNLDGRPEGKTSIGRPKLRWLDDDVNDLRNMGVRRWRTEEENGREWAGMLRKVKVKLKRKDCIAKEEYFPVLFYKY